MYFPAPLLVSSGKPTQVQTSGYSRQTKYLQKNPRGWATIIEIEEKKPGEI